MVVDRSGRCIVGRSTGNENRSGGLKSTADIKYRKALYIIQHNSATWIIQHDIVLLSTSAKANFKKLGDSEEQHCGLVGAYSGACLTYCILSSPSCRFLCERRS